MGKRLIVVLCVCVRVTEAVELLRSWASEQKLAGMTIEILREPGRTPVIFIIVPAFAGAGGNTAAVPKADDPNQPTVLLYGHGQ